MGGSGKCIWTWTWKYVSVEPVGSPLLPPEKGCCTWNKQWCWEIGKGVRFWSCYHLRGQVAPETDISKTLCNMIDKTFKNHLVWVRFLLFVARKSYWVSLKKKSGTSWENYFQVRLRKDMQIEIRHWHVKVMRMVSSAFCSLKRKHFATPFLEFFSWNEI